MYISALVLIKFPVPTTPGMRLQWNYANMEVQHRGLLLSLSVYIGILKAMNLYGASDKGQLW